MPEARRSGVLTGRQFGLVRPNWRAPCAGAGRNPFGAIQVGARLVANSPNVDEGVGLSGESSRLRFVRIYAFHLDLLEMLHAGSKF